MCSMSTRTAYDIRRDPAGRSDKSDSRRRVKPAHPAVRKAAKARIRALLIVRGTSLRAYAHEWAKAQGIDDPDGLQRVYNAARMTVERWCARPDAPPQPGSLSARFLADLLDAIGDPQRVAAGSREPVETPAGG